MSFEGEVVDHRDAPRSALEARMCREAEFLIRVDRWLEIDRGRYRLYPLAFFLVFCVYLALFWYFVVAKGG